MIGVLIALVFVFLGFQIFQMEVAAAGVRAVLLVLLIVLYCTRNDRPERLFLWFLISFGIAEIMNVFGWLVPFVPDNNIDVLYYVANFTYITSYSLLMIHILGSMKLREVFTKYPIHILVLIILDVFSVMVVTNTAVGRLNFHEYYMELAYNAVIMTLLSVAVINYIHKEDKKSIFLLIGCVSIFFSEVLQLAYFYVSDINLLNVVCSVFLVFAFFFFYIQSRLTYQPQEYVMHPDLRA